MKQRIDLYEECRLWPIGVELLPERVLYSLWGDAGGEDDRILADRRGFLLFTRCSQLASFLSRAVRTSFSGRPGLARLRRHLRQGGRLPLSRVLVYRFREVHDVLATFEPSHIDRSTSSHVVNCLNLLWDIARNRNDMHAQALLQGRAPLATLLDVLTFHDPANAALPVRLRYLNPAALATAYATLTGQFLLSSWVVA